MEEPVIIDNKVLKVLAVDTRMEILKELSNGSRTPSDLGRKLNKSDATIVEHLDILRDSNMIKKIENPGKKWVFYKLTDRGMNIISGKPKGLVVILAVSLLALMMGAGLMGNMFSYQTGMSYSKIPAAAESRTAENQTSNIQAFPYVPFALIAAGVFGILFYIVKKARFSIDRMKIWISLLLIALILCSMSSIVKADGVVIPHRPPYDPVEENEQIAAINYQNGLEKMIIAVNFDMQDMSEAAWVFPVPSDPEDVVIDVVSGFPQFSGSDVVARAKSDIDGIVQISQLTQIYPIFRYLFFGRVYTSGLANMESSKFGTGIAGVPSVTVYEHLEKDGITTEIVTARTGEALYYYLNNRGYTIPIGSISVLDDYIGKDYTFVISWVTSPTLISGQQYPYYTSPYARQPGIFVTFPTEKIYFPMTPTSVYGSKRIPIRIYLMGYVTPDISGEVTSYTKTSYFVQDYFDKYEFREFFGDGNPNGYTRVDVYAPSKYLEDDFWFKQEVPSKVSYASAIYSTISRNPLPSLIVFIVGTSAITGAIAGLLVFGNWKKYALLGTTNLLSIIGLMIAITAVKTKKVDESLKRKLREEGMLVISTDKRKFAFLVIFSIGFLIIGAIIGFLLKAPLL